MRALLFAASLLASSALLAQDVRKDAAGKLLPLHFIQEVSVSVNGKVVLEGQISQAVSRNPVFSFRLKGAKAGDKLEIAWLDSKGERSLSDAVIA